MVAAHSSTWCQYLHHRVTWTCLLNAYWSLLFVCKACEYLEGLPNRSGHLQLLTKLTNAYSLYSAQAEALGVLPLTSGHWPYLSCALAALLPWFPGKEPQDFVKILECVWLHASKAQEHADGVGAKANPAFVSQVFTCCGPTKDTEVLGIAYWYLLTYWYLLILDVAPYCTIFLSRRSTYGADLMFCLQSWKMYTSAQLLSLWTPNHDVLEGVSMLWWPPVLHFTCSKSIAIPNVQT